jgi:hypothetical protein
MRYGNKNLSDPDKIADAFADHFAQSFINNNNNSRSYNQDGLNLSFCAIVLYLVVYHVCFQNGKLCLLVANDKLDGK